MELMIDEKPLSPAEQDRLGELENVIRENLKAWYAVGIAMIEIREKRLYRNEEGRTWEGYCREIFDMSHQHADRQIAAARVIENLTPIGVKEDGSVDWELLPANEAQARELARLQPEEQKQVWQQLITPQRDAETEDDRPKITAKAVKNAVKSLKGDQFSQTARRLKDDLAKAIGGREKANQFRESELFKQALNNLIEQIEEERRVNWKHTSREVVFNALARLAEVVGDCGEQTMRDKKITFRWQNLEKLLAAGWSVFRKGGELAIEQLSEDGSWLLYGEYETEQQRDDAYADVLLERTSIQA